MIFTLKDELAQARTVKLIFKPCEFQPGETITFTVDLLVGETRPSEMLTLDRLLIAKDISPCFELVSAMVEDLQLAADPDASPVVEGITTLPDHDGFKFHPIKVSPLNRLVITLRSVSEAVRTFEGCLVCKVEPVLGMWFGQDVGTKKEWIVEILGRTFVELLDWRRQSKRLREEAARKRDEDSRECCCYEEDFSPVCDADKLPLVEVEPAPERIRDHLRYLVIDILSVASFPFQAALHLTSKALADLTSDKTPEATGYFILDCGSTNVEGGDTANISMSCQVPFRPSALVIPPLVAGNFTIVDFKVGKNSQFISAKSVPASAFALADGTPIALKMDVLLPGQWITITVQNNTDLTQAFKASLTGRTEAWPNG